MVKLVLLNTGMALVLMLGSGLNINAQDETKETKSSVSVNADLVSRYVWRGVDYGNSPAIQPGIEYANGNFAFGTWGSYSTSSNTGGLEADLYTSYSFGFGLSIGVTDYYFPGEKVIAGVDPADSLSMVVSPQRSGNYFDYENAHTFEANLGYDIGGLSISANYVFYGGADDLYFELAYALSDVTIFAGGGNSMYTKSGDFNVVNAGISVSKEIEITDKYALPAFGSLIINPDLEQIHLVFGLSF